MIELRLIVEIIKEWHMDYITHIKSYGLSDSMEPHVNDLIDKFCERLEMNRDIFND